jgi:hypothetical protein
MEEPMSDRNQWGEIEQLRREQINRLRRNQSPDSDADQRIDDLIRELEASGDLDAAAQRSIIAITRLVERGEITKCEAFARAMQSLATAVQRTRGNLDSEEFLKLAWGYLGSEQYQRRIDRRAGWLFKSYHRNHLFSEERRAREGYSPGANWANKHDPSEGEVGSGWFPPLPGDTHSKDARSGKHDHFLANALAEYYKRRGHPIVDIGILIETLRSESEEVETDLKMNEFGRKFGGMLRLPHLSPTDIHYWIRNNMCTESRKEFFLIQGEGVKKDFRPDESATYWDVEFRITGTPRPLVTWREHIRSLGDRSWYGWYYSKQVEVDANAFRDVNGKLKKKRLKRWAMQFVQNDLGNQIQPRP